MARYRNPRKNVDEPGKPKQPSFPVNLYHGQALPGFNDPLGKSGLNWLSQLGQNGMISPIPPNGGSSQGSSGQGTTGSQQSTMNINDLLAILGSKRPSSIGSEDADSTYYDMLKNLGFDDQFSKLLGSLGYKGGDNLSDDQIADWNNKILDLVLNYYQNLEQRNYNEGLLKDQRLYDTPTNQLARLMGAGISRDAAIAMLSGSGGSGSALPYQQGITPASGLAPSESALNETNRKLAIANTVFGGLSALGGLVGLGFSVPQAIHQTKLLANSSYMSDQQRQAYDAASGAYSIITSAGVPNAAEVFGSVQKTVSTITELAKNGDQAALAYIKNGNVTKLLQTSPVSSPLLAQMYKDERSAEDYDSLTNAAIKQARLNQAYTQAMSDKIGAEMSLIGTQEDAVSQSIVESCRRVAQIDADIFVKNEQGKFIKLQSSRYNDIVNAQIDELASRADLQESQKELLDQQFEYNDAGFPMLKEARILELQDELAHLKLINNPEQRANRLARWAQDESNARALAYLESVRINGVSAFAVQHPGLWNLSCGFHYCGASDVVKPAVAGAAVAGKLALSLL